jgi:hypothetical protein
LAKKLNGQGLNGNRERTALPKRML